MRRTRICLSLDDDLLSELHSQRQQLDLSRYVEMLLRAPVAQERARRIQLGLCDPVKETEELMERILNQPVIENAKENEKLVKKLKSK